MRILNLISVVLISAIGITGCGEKSIAIEKPDPKDHVSKYRDIPVWVNESSNPYISVGSAPFRGQDYIMQRDEAVAIAKSNLVMQVESKVDALYKSYKASIGSTATQNDNVFRRTTSQVASRILAGTMVSKTYMSNDGELFVRIVLDSNFANVPGANNEQKILLETLRSETAFKELEVEVEKIKKVQ